MSNGSIFAPTADIEKPHNEGGGHTFFTINRQPTIAEIDHASQFEDYTVHLVPFDHDRLKDPVSEDGRRYRWAGLVRVVPYAKEIRLYLYNGVREYDVEFLKKQAALIRAGYFNQTPWTERKSKKVPGETFFQVSLSYEFKIQTWQLGSVVVPCTEPDCGSDWHTEEDPGVVKHTGTTTTGPANSWNGAPQWEMRAEKYGDEEWRSAISIDDEPLTAQQLVGFLNDLKWLKEDIDQLNRIRAAVEA